ncbi:ABC transporter permease [Corallococcus praedator]|uniref:ABC transporter permease n=1 Tax=Corallococcus praedator TaxID=2316724 RepID=A0ABX9QE85_9BACT|nr:MULTISPECIES: ABC transporter permease [Corallococcus]RKH25375.1 ABC transporter permease [Corallococcus sp. CA031C]RKI02628.1 ABC transporter permease [Corallococcus praedator]
MSIIDSLVADVRFALRTFRRAPGFASVAILCVALGIGANAIIFSVVHGVLMGPLPYSQPERLVSLFEVRSQSSRGQVSWPMFWVWRQEASAFERMAAFNAGGTTLQTEESSERLDAIRGTADYFAVYGVPALLGRTFEQDEDLFGQEPVAVLSEDLWRTRFGADPAVLGRSIMLDRVLHTVVGVMPASFDASTDVWMPLVAPPDAQTRTRGFVLNVRARMAPGVSLEKASAQLKEVAAQVGASQAQGPRSAQVIPLREGLTETWRTPLQALLGAVALVLLIACTNVANLLLARAGARQQELAIRVALGAGRGRLIQQFLVESLILALLGGALGALLARWGLDALLALAPDTLPRQNIIAIDGTSLLFLSALTVASGIGFGLLPALHVSRLDVRGGLVAKGSAGGGTSPSRRLRASLVIAEIALSLILLVGAGLLGRSFLLLMGTSPGLATEQILTLHLGISKDRFFKDGVLDVDLAPRLLQPVLDEVRALPGVSAAGMTSVLPIQRAWNNARYTVEGEPSPEPGDEPTAERRASSPGYFATMSIPLLQGRDFTAQDTGTGESVVIINEALARRHFKDKNAVGRRLMIGTVVATIIGVVGDVRQAGLDKEPLAEFHLPYGRPWGDDSLVLVVHTALAPETLLPSVREAVRRVDGSLPLYRAMTMEQVIAKSLGLRRLVLCLLGTFAMMALVLSAYGLHGVISLLVTQRTQEIGIRMALGASTGDILRLILGQGARLTGMGIAVGFAGALILARVLGSQLYGVTAWDPLTFGAGSLLLASVALLACWLPARRALRADPIRAIRSE